MIKSRIRVSLRSACSQERVTTPLKIDHSSSVSQRPNTTVKKIRTDTPSASQKKTEGVQLPQNFYFSSALSVWSSNRPPRPRPDAKR